MTIFITGGASGLGRSITERLARSGEHEVHFTYNSSVQAAEELLRAYKNTRAVKCDFRDSSEVSGLLAYIDDLDIDILINNAYFGTFINTYFHKTPAINFAEEFNANVVPTIMVTQAAIKKFRIRKSGKIITILTAALAEDPPVGASVYVANKSYLASLTKSWASENAKFNITSNAVSPSLMRTNFTKDIDERLLEKIQEAHPLGKLLTTAEVAEVVFSLANASAATNGINIIMNGISPGNFPKQGF